MGNRLVIGYGNPLRGDDGVGPEIAQRLQQSLAASDVGVVVVHQLTPELADVISKSDQTVFIDCSQKGEAGTWRLEAIETSPELVQPLEHHLTPPALLAYCQTIYRQDCRGFVLSVSGQRFDFSEQLSPEVQAVVPEIVDYLVAFLGSEPRPVS